MLLVMDNHKAWHAVAPTTKGYCSYWKEDNERRDPSMETWDGAYVGYHLQQNKQSSKALERNSKQRCPCSVLWRAAGVVMVWWVDRRIMVGSHDFVCVFVVRTVHTSMTTDGQTSVVSAPRRRGPFSFDSTAVHPFHPHTPLFYTVDVPGTDSYQHPRPLTGVASIGLLRLGSLPRYAAPWCFPQIIDSQTTLVPFGVESKEVSPVLEGKKDIEFSEALGQQHTGENITSGASDMCSSAVWEMTSSMERVSGNGGTRPGDSIVVQSLGPKKSSGGSRAKTLAVGALMILHVAALQTAPAVQAFQCPHQIRRSIVLSPTDQPVARLKIRLAASSPNPDEGSPDNNSPGEENAPSPNLVKEEDNVSDELWSEIQEGQPSEWDIMKKLLGINIFTYILAAAIAFFLSMNILLGQGWLGSAMGIKGTGTFVEQSDQLPRVVDLSDQEFSL